MGSMITSRLSHYKQDGLTEYFVLGSTARTTASLCGVNRKRAAFYFLRPREIIGYELEAESEAIFGGEIEVDESYFGSRQKEKRGRGAAGKVPVFRLSLPDSGLFANHEKVKKGEKVHSKIILNFVPVAGHWGTLPQSVKGAPNGTTSTQLYRRL